MPSSELFVGLLKKKNAIDSFDIFHHGLPPSDLLVLPRCANFSPQREEKLEDVHSCGKITIFFRKIHYKLSFSIAMLNYQRVIKHIGNCL